MNLSMAHLPIMGPKRRRAVSATVKPSEVPDDVPMTIAEWNRIAQDMFAGNDSAAQLRAADFTRSVRERFPDQTGGFHVPLTALYP